jgi:hypothetical protein
MKVLWCWRCKTEVPMLDNEEFRRALSLGGTAEGYLGERQFEAVLQEYERITGFRETNINAFYHHVVSLYGPPCPKCGKPLRTPRAKLCGFCMQQVRER